MKTKNPASIARHLMMAIVAMLALASPVAAQLAIPKSVIGSGAARSSGGGIRLEGTIGQSVIGVTTNPGTTLSQGFWYMPSATPSAVAEEIGSVAAFTSTPNPFSTTSTIRITLDKREHLLLALYDGLGRHVRTLYDGEREAGELLMTLDAGTLSSGAYMAHLTAGDLRRTLRIVVAK